MIGDSVKKLICVSGLAIGLMFTMELAVVAGPAFDSLLSAAGSDSAALPVVFDGAPKLPCSGFLPLQCSPVTALAHGGTGGRPRQGFFTVPPPKPSGIVSVGAESNKNRETASFPIEGKTDGPILKKGIVTLRKAVPTGKSLADFFETESVEIRWKPLPNRYAEACHPKECGDKKVIYLNNGLAYKNLFLSSDSTFLAVVLAHEVTHIRDYKNIDGELDPYNKTPAALFLELNGLSAETYVYHQLLKSGIAPKPNSSEENSDIQETRLNLAIWEYMNGGKVPSAREYLAIIKEWGIKRDLNLHIGEVTKVKKPGIMSLASVVEVLYDFDPALESMKDPGLFASFDKKRQYRQYTKIRETLEFSTKEYIKWRKENVDPPPPATNNSGGVVAPAVSSAGQGHNPPSQPSSPSNGDDGEGGGGGSSGGGHQPVVPNPSFEPGTWPTSGQ